MFEKIITACSYLLNNFPEAQECRDYLNSRINANSQKQFKFGYYPDLKNLSALIDIVGKDELIKNRLLFQNNIEDALGPRIFNKSHFENFPLIMPYCDAYDKIVGIVGRSLLNDKERDAQEIYKYKNTAGFKKSFYLYGLYESKQEIINNNCVYIVEGQFDVIKAIEKGFKNIVALGTSSMSLYQFSAITRYTDNIFLLLDNDESGEKGRKLITNKFNKYANIQNFYLPEEYKDIDDYFTKTNDEAISFVIK